MYLAEQILSWEGLKAGFEDVREQPRNDSPSPVHIPMRHLGVVQHQSAFPGALRDHNIVGGCWCWEWKHPENFQAREVSCRTKKSLLELHCDASPISSYSWSHHKVNWLGMMTRSASSVKSKRYEMYDM